MSVASTAWLMGVDFQLEHWINAAAGSQPLLDAAMVALARWSELFFIAAVGLWFGVGLVRRSAPDRCGAGAALLASGLALAVNQVISLLWTRPRPFAAHPGRVHVLLAHTADASFPSDHVAAAMAIAVVLFMIHRRLGTLAILLAAAVGYARVFVGDHYPGDVAGGALVGVLAGAVLGAPAVRRAIARVDSTVSERLASS
ncbi:MAG: phosphatase PAP2 family protein [Candidatus Dormibacteria bacterium]